MSKDNTKTFDDIINNFEKLYKNLLVKNAIVDSEQVLMITILELVKNQRTHIVRLEQERKIEDANLEHRIQQALNISKDGPEF